MTDQSMFRAPIAMAIEIRQLHGTRTVREVVTAKLNPNARLTDKCTNLEFTAEQEVDRMTGICITPPPEILHLSRNLAIPVGLGAELLVKAFHKLAVQYGSSPEAYTIHFETWPSECHLRHIEIIRCSSMVRLTIQIPAHQVPGDHDDVQDFVVSFSEKTEVYNMSGFLHEPTVMVSVDEVPFDTKLQVLQYLSRRAYPSDLLQGSFRCTGAQRAIPHDIRICAVLIKETFLWAGDGAEDGDDEKSAPKRSRVT